MMLTKKKGDQSQGNVRRLKIWARMIKSKPVSPYTRMDAPLKKSKAVDVEVLPKAGKDKENQKPVTNKEAKEKKPKKKGWKRFRQVALTSCRYIGLGVTHMSAAATYPPGGYHVDPKYWNKSFSPSYHTTHVTSQTPSWTSGMMFSGW